MYPSTEQITKRSAEEEEEEEERRGHSPLSLGREATKPRLSGYRGHIVRARTRGARGGESTARLAPSRQLEHSRPLRVLRARPFLPSFVRSFVTAAIPSSLFLFFSALSLHGVPAPLFSPRPPSTPSFASSSSSSRRWRVERAERERERFDSLLVFLLFSASSFDV